MKILIISSLCASARNMGGVRIRRVVAALVKLGHSVTVLTEGAEGILPEVPASGVRCVAVASLGGRLRRRRARAAAEDVSLRGRDNRLTNRLNRWLAIPDPQVAWYRPAVREGLRLARADRPDLIFASQGPRTDLLVAASLGRRTRVPVVMEYRDLWTGIPYRHLSAPTALHRWLHRRLEARALRAASAVTCLSEGIRAHLRAAHPGLSRIPVEVNYNFFDVPGSAPARRGTAAPFRICYLGALYESRHPGVFLEALAAVIRHGRLTPAQIRFEWAGPIVGMSGLAQLLEREALTPFVNYRGDLPHVEAMAVLRQSHVALVLTSPADTVHVPGKLFEAMGERVPVLLVTQCAEAAALVARAKAGLACRPEAEAVRGTLERLRAWQFGGAPWEFDEREIAKFSAKEAVGKLAALFEQVRQAAAGAGPGEAGR